jgi:hypothetical protein
MIGLGRVPWTQSKRKKQIGRGQRTIRRSSVPWRSKTWLLESSWRSSDESGWGQRVQLDRVTRQPAAHSECLRLQLPTHSRASVRNSLFTPRCASLLRRHCHRRQPIVGVATTLIVLCFVLLCMHDVYSRSLRWSLGYATAHNLGWVSNTRAAAIVQIYYYFVNLGWSRALRCLYTFIHALFRYSNCRRRILGRRLGFRVDPGLRIFSTLFLRN